MQETEQSSYRSIFKATSLFGGVKVYTIILSILRTKVIAVILGPTGVGIIGLYQTALSMVQGYTSMSLSTSAVRDVSEANSEGNIEKVSVVVFALQRLVWITGLLGTCSVIIFSPILSKTAFGNSDYTIPFILLSATLLINQLSSGQIVVLQGLRRLKEMAKATALGATMGLVFTIPIYYIMGLEGIVPTIILNALITLYFSWYYARKVKLKKVNLNLKQTLKTGTLMLKMGFAMSLSSVLVYSCSYILMGFLRNKGGTEAVGLLNAGYTIIASYVSMIFTAISADYYPRLVGSIKDYRKMAEIVNQQGEIASLIMGPVIAALLVFLPFVINVLYTDSFIGASVYIFYAVIGLMFKMGAWLISFQIIAKGDMKLYIINEIASNIYSLIFSILGYLLWGMAGLGVAFTLGYFIYYAQVFFITKHFYLFTFSTSFISTFLIELLFILMCMILVNYSPSILIRYGSGLLMVFCAGYYSLNGLRRRMGLTFSLKHLIKRRINGSTKEQ